MYFFLAAYPLLGAGLKYIDDAFDEKIFSKKLAMVLAPFLGILWAYTMLIDPFSATILLAIILGVFIRGKIDNYAHMTGLVVILIILVFAGVNLLFLPLIFIATAAFLDEMGNDVIDKNRDYFNDSKFLHKITLYFFDQRWLTKIAVLFVVLVGIFPLYFFLAILLFDGAYLTVRLYTRSRQQTKKATYA
jgi:hypothetical protein